MFVRFRHVGRRLKVSLAETRRADGKMLQEHIASLGSIVTPPAVAARIAFWQSLHDRLARLANRVDTETQGKILGAVHARIPMVTIDEIRALQLENAEADERFWAQLQDMHEHRVGEHTALRAAADRQLAAAQAGAMQAKDKAAVVKDRIDRLQKGEPVAGSLGKPMSREELLKLMGWNESDVRHANRLAAIDTVPGAWGEFIEKLVGSRRRDKAASLAFFKRLLNSGRLRLD